jgi:hypothetical protein
MSETVLFVGYSDSFTTFLSRDLQSAGVRSVVIDEVAMSDLHLAPSEEASLPLLRHRDEVIDWKSAIAILPNQFSVPTSFDSGAKELFWSEWTALFAHLLATHANVLNPPSRGAWCGSFPTVFEQIAFVGRQLLDVGIACPTARDLATDLWAAGGLRDVPVERLFCVPASFYRNEVADDTQDVEMVASFIDHTVICPPQFSSFVPRLRGAIEAFQRCTGARMGQLRLSLFDDVSAFRGVSARPNPALCSPGTWSDFSQELIKHILVTRDIQ